MITLHCVSLPHTQTTSEYSWCAYTQKVVRFGKMMMSEGYRVVIYSGEENEAVCDEHVAVLPESLRQQFYGDNGKVPDFSQQNFNIFNLMAVPLIRQRIEQYGPDEGHVLCIIGGSAQQPIAAGLPEVRCVEFGIGYSGVFADFRVFESYAWMHTVYGSMMTAHGADGRWYDTVIPNYFDPADFPRGQDHREDFLLYLGRVTNRKGYQVACQIAEAANRQLLIAGDGVLDARWQGHPLIEHLGRVGPAQRADLLGRTHALLAPTVYVEPFGGAVVEAMMCGTPVITTDWGAFTETVRHGVDGFRCRLLRDFVQAIDEVESLDKNVIRAGTLDRFSTTVIGPRYSDYFRRLQTIDNNRGGWYAMDLTS